MNQENNIWIITAVVVVVIAIGGYVLRSQNQKTGISVAENNVSTVAVKKTTKTTARQPQGKEVTGFTALTSQELSDMLPKKDFKLIDVHIPEQLHIPGTDNMIAYNDVDALVAANPNKDAKIVLYCRSGGMSKVAAKALVAKGYTNVFDLTNGMNEWSAQGRETVSKGSVPILN